MRKNVYDFGFRIFRVNEYALFCELLGFMKINWIDYELFSRFP